MASRYYFVAIIVCVVFLVLLLLFFYSRHLLQKRRLRQKADRMDREANQMMQQWRAVQEPPRSRSKYYNEPLTTYISASSQSTYNSETLPTYSNSDHFARPYTYYRHEWSILPPQNCQVCKRPFKDSDAVKQAYGGLVHQQCM